MDYIEVKICIDPFSDERAEIVLAEIDQLGFESYQTEEPYLKGYITRDKFSEHDLKTLLSAFLSGDFKVSYTLDFIREENWNAVWESDFKPITVAGLCIIKAPYHHGLPKTRYTINIDPKMAFGSGHHETTCLMIKEMLELLPHRGGKKAAKENATAQQMTATDQGNSIAQQNANGSSTLLQTAATKLQGNAIAQQNATGSSHSTAATKQNICISGARVLDMGCGTGVLSILAAKMGAAVPVHAIDIDPIAVHSAEDNARRNRIPHKVKTLCGDASLIQTGQYDIVLANITRNILLSDLSTYARALRPEGGTILLSGFFEEDIPLLLAEASNCGLHLVSKKTRNHWTMLRLTK